MCTAFSRWWVWGGLATVAVIGASIVCMVGSAKARSTRARLLWTAALAVAPAVWFAVNAALLPFDR